MVGFPSGKKRRYRVHIFFFLPFYKSLLLYISPLTLLPSSEIFELDGLKGKNQVLEARVEVEVEKRKRMEARLQRANEDAEDLREAITIAATEMSALRAKRGGGSSGSAEPATFEVLESGAFRRVSS